MDLGPDSSTWTSSPKKAPELPTLRSQQNTIGKPTNGPQNPDTASPIGRPALEPHKVHQDNSTTDDATPEHEYTYLNKTQPQQLEDRHDDDEWTYMQRKVEEEAEVQYEQYKWDLELKKAREDAKALHINIMRDCNNLNQEVVCHGPYLTEEDHVISDGMRKRKPWKEQMSTISKDLVHLECLINTHDIARTDVDIDTLVARVNNLREQITGIIASIEQADEEQGIFSDQPIKLCPMQIPSYSATPSEDFIIFRDKFREAAKDNRISKTDQAEKLRGALTGKAELLISNLPYGTTPVDDFWSILEKQFGNSSLEHIKFHLDTLKATQTLSDITIENDPDEAVVWFLDFENTIQSILRIGIPYISSSKTDQC